MQDESSRPPAEGERVAPPGGGSGGGAPASNTAPPKYTSGTIKRLLRVAVDSLYLSYSGELAGKWRAELEQLKKLAQSGSLKDRVEAQARVGDHIFAVRDKGRGRFAWVLDDNAFDISISDGRSMPLAYVQIRAEYLAHVGPVEAERALRYVVSTLGLVVEPVNVSRIDLCVDFETDADPGAWPVRSWVSRGIWTVPHYQHVRFSGISIGPGGGVSVRLYDKTLEIRTKQAGYHAYEIWQRSGWEGGEPVWRLEAQLRRQVLKELGIETLDKALQNLGGAWRYVTEDWLRLCEPNPEDANRSRWPVCPLWAELAAVIWASPNQQRLSRCRLSRIPSDDKLIPAGSGYVLAMMARDGITNLREGFEAFEAATRRYYDEIAAQRNQTVGRLVSERLKDRRRRFNVAYNAENAIWRRRQIEAEAEAYRRGKDGEQPGEAAEEGDEGER